MLYVLCVICVFVFPCVAGSAGHTRIVRLAKVPLSVCLLSLGLSPLKVLRHHRTVHPVGVEPRVRQLLARRRAARNSKAACQSATERERASAALGAVGIQWVCTYLDL